ncbi:MAG: preprotein translocase subunit SecG [Verrucomicrobiota bacterium]
MDTCLFVGEIGPISHQLAALQAPASPPYCRSMTLAAIDWLSISINLLLVIFVIVSLLMTLLILMQRPKQEGLGAAFGGGVTDQVFGARTTNVLQRGTVYLGSLFFLLSLTLAVLIGHKNQKTTLVAPKKEVKETVEEKAVVPAPAAPASPAAPAAPEIPAAPAEANAPAAPANQAPAELAPTPAPVAPEAPKSESSEKSDQP